VIFVLYLAKKSTDKLSGLKPRPVVRHYACDICGRVYIRPNMLEKHRRLQHGIESDTTVQSEKPVMDHSHTNGTGSDHRSSTGDESTKTVMNHAGDGKNVCVGKALYVCGECGGTFDEETGVTSHIFTKHICKYT